MKLDLRFNAAIDEYDTRARMLYDALRSGEEEAAWRFKWEHLHSAAKVPKPYDRHRSSFTMRARS